MSAPGHDQYAFLSLISFPVGHEAIDVAHVLANAGVLDVPTLKLHLGRPPPMILGRLPADMARFGASAMIEAGGDAFAPTLEEIQSLGATFKIKQLELIDGGFQVELWRGKAIEIIWRKDVQALVRAQIAKEKIKKVEGRGPNISISTAVAFGPSVAIAGALSQEPTADITKEISSSDKIDMHLADGRVFQIDGDKFGFAILGDMKGGGDAKNMDKMLDLLTHLMPDAIVDRYFSLFKPPSGHDRIRLPMMQINDDDPAFAFYSRWAALMYRHVVGAH